MTDPTANLRNASLTKAIMAEVRRIATQPWNIMETCGGQPHAIMQYGLDQLLPPEITLIHGPGCPVCVTSLQAIEQGLQIASRPGVSFTTFGDMLRVPGNQADLFTARSQGADVRVVYSPLDSLKIANANPDKQVVFFAIGFETTAPTIASTILTASRNGVSTTSPSFR
jgi:hydrogenase expression/formation protein HypD